MGINRRQVLGGAVAVAGLAATGVATGAPAAHAAAGRAGNGAGHALGYKGDSALWEEFAAAPYTHPQIPYVGRAGCGGGARRLPRQHRTFHVRDFGARPRRRGSAAPADNAPAINAAVEAAVRAGGGTVQLDAGTYDIAGIVRIGGDNVVLRGAGRGATTLHATKSLTDLVGPYGSRYGGDKSSWSWAGGLVWVCPEERWTSLVAAIKAQHWPFEGWTGNARDEFRTLTALRPARRGDRVVTVADPSAVRPGRLVLLRLSDDAEHTLLAHMAGEVPGTTSYVWDDKTKLTSYVPYEWPVRVTAVDGDRLTLERPLPLDVRPEWQPALTTLVTPVTGSGVEALTVEMVETPQSQHLLDKGYNGVVLQCAYDCWVDDVRVVHADNGFGLVAASSCTLRRTSVGGRGSHHPYFCREGSHDNLVEDFRIEQRTVPAPEGTQLHGINVEGLSSYNAWSRGVMEMGTFDTHRGMPFANVRTQITVDNTGQHGGDASAGPLYGARFVHWDVTVTNGRAGCVKIDRIAPYSATVGISEVREFGQIDVPDFTGELHTRIESYGDPGAVRPANLYEAQRDM